MFFHDEPGTSEDDPKSLFTLFDEIDALFPHVREGGRVAADPARYGSVRTLTRSRSLASTLQHGSRPSGSSSQSLPLPSKADALAGAQDRMLARVIAKTRDEQHLRQSVGNMTRDDDPRSGGPSTVDWYSLSESCRRTKDAFYDGPAARRAVQNMFLTHLDSLAAVLGAYADGGGAGDGRRDTRARATEAKRALRFAAACLAPPRTDEDMEVVADGGAVAALAHYRFARWYRTASQEAAAVGGLPAVLVRVVAATGPPLAATEDGGDATSSLAREHSMVRVLAARLLCHLVTDNPVAAGLTLGAVAFSPRDEGRASRLVEEVIAAAGDKNAATCWSNLIVAAARSDGPEERDVLAAAAAALHNLLTSLEACEEARFDVRFEVASNKPLLKALLRNLAPAEAAPTQPWPEHDRSATARPQFKPPASTVDDTADSAAEWISLILERLASCTLLPQMLATVGDTGSAVVTPAEAALATCLRQAMYDYHATRTPAGEAGGFGRRRLSVEAQAAGLSAATTRPHPLWGRADGAVARRVPVLLSLAHRAEEARLRAGALRGRAPGAAGGERARALCLTDDLCDILAQSLEGMASATVEGADVRSDEERCIANTRSVIGRETSLLANCCADLASIVDAARDADAAPLGPADWRTAGVIVHLVGNLARRCHHNQELLRTAPVATATGDTPDLARTGLQVLVAAASLGPAGGPLRERCAVAVRRIAEGYAANSRSSGCGRSCSHGQPGYWYNTEARDGCLASPQGSFAQRTKPVSTKKLTGSVL